VAHDKRFRQSGHSQHCQQQWGWKERHFFTPRKHGRCHRYDLQPLGERIFFSSSYLNSWPAREVSAGVYFYAVQNECRKEWKGTVAVIVSEIDALIIHVILTLTSSEFLIPNPFSYFIVMKSSWIAFGLSVVLLACSSNSEIDHWESLVRAGDEWKYFLGNASPGKEWFSTGYDDVEWKTGPGGIGFGTGDFKTRVGTAPSLFLRKKFTVHRPKDIAALALHVEYDDGFIVYLNGQEVARRNMGTEKFADYNRTASAAHEPVLRSDGVPEYIDLTFRKSILKNGENLLAIQVHNESPSSPDLSASVFLSAGLTTKTKSYSPVPSWFVPRKEISSNLPIIAITTKHGQTISNEKHVIAHMGIIYNGKGKSNLTRDSFNDFDGKISIRVRGESSQSFPKKSFTIETKNDEGEDLNASLLGMPAETDWILYAPYTDKTLLRDVLAYEMGRDIGMYTPQTRPAELYLDGEYQGVYILIEKIKIGSDRVDITPLKPEATSGKAVTGGYILRVDKWDSNDFPYWESQTHNALPNERTIKFQFVDPRGNDLSPEQVDYIKKYILDFESALSSSNYKSPEGYKAFIDVASFIDFMIVNEVSKNVDAYIFSTYMHKANDRDGGLLKMGPLWDFNLAFGNVDYNHNAQFAPGWMFNDNIRMYWFRRLRSDDDFKNRFNCRWKELRTSVFTDEYFTDKIDALAEELDDAQERNFKKWPILGSYVWPNQYVGGSYQKEIDFLKKWIQARLDWMDKNTSASCE
jgi:hypothetical protein